MDTRIKPDHIGHYWKLALLGLYFTVAGCEHIPGKEYAKPRIEWEKDLHESSKPEVKVKIEVGTQIDLSGV